MLRLCMLIIAFASSGALAAGSKADAKRLAREHFQRAETYYEAGAYAQAIEEYQVAYKLAPLPGLLFDIAKALRLKGETATAIEYYQRYLKEEPQGPGAAEAKAQVARLQKKVEAEAVTATVETPAPSIPAPSIPSPSAPAPVAAPAPSAVPAAVLVPVAVAPEHPAVEASAQAAEPIGATRWPAWALGGTGVAVGAAGGLLVGLSRGDYAHLQNSCGPSCDPALTSGSRTKESVGFALVGVGAVAVASGLVWFLATSGGP